MKRNTAFKILNPVIGIMLVIQMCSGIFRHSLSRDAFELLHEVNGIALAVLIVLHVILNWNWINANFFKKPSKA